MIRLHPTATAHTATRGANGNGRGAEVDSQVTIRFLADGDAHALRTLAERDSARAPSGHVLGAERSGRLLAAISTSSGQVVADPFHPTADLVRLLRLQARQLVPPLG
jgi:non-ribosomal peptide synthetase component F